MGDLHAFRKYLHNGADGAAAHHYLFLASGVHEVFVVASCKKQCPLRYVRCASYSAKAQSVKRMPAGVAQQRSEAVAELHMLVDKIHDRSRVQRGLKPVAVASEEQLAKEAQRRYQRQTSGGTRSTLRSASALSALAGEVQDRAPLIERIAALTGATPEHERKARAEKIAWMAENYPGG